MSISSIDMAKALNSSAYAEKIVKSGNLSEEQRQRLSNKYGESQLTNWENDSTVYQIDDTDETTKTSSSDKSRGVERAKEATEYDGGADNAGSKAGTAIGGVFGAAGAVMGIVTALTSLVNSLKGYISNPYMNAVVGTILLANATALKAMNPNKDAAAALDILAQEELPEMQAQVQDSEAAIINDGEEIQDLIETANENKETATEEVGKQQALFAGHKKIIESYNSKDDKQKTAADSTSAQVSRAQMSEISSSIESTITDASEENGKITEDIASLEDDYSVAQDDLELARGEIEYATSFDEDTENNAHMLNVTSRLAGVGSVGVVAGGVQAIATAGPFNIPQYIAGGVAIGTGAASAVLYNLIANQQSDYENSASAEIEVRNELVDVTDVATETFDEEIENYTDNLELGAELAEPVEMPKLEMAEVKTTNQNAKIEKEDVNKPNKEEPAQNINTNESKTDNKQSNGIEDFKSPFFEKDEEIELF